MDAHCLSILKEFDDNYNSYKKIEEIVLAKLREVLKQSNIPVTAIEGRVKKRNSLEGKLELKGYKYSSLRDITDIFGGRIIAFYEEQVDKIASIMETVFDIDWENSIDKRKTYNADQFGYMSLHYICRIPKSMYFDEEHPEINELRFELQIRTTLQHVWATAVHDTGYKSTIEVPTEYIRELNRLAGLLEIADSEFSTILRKVEEYRRNVASLIKKGDFASLELDGDTFSSYLAIEPFKMLNDKIAAINKAEIQSQNMMAYLSVFKGFGFTTIADIEDLKKKYSDDAYRLAVLQIGSTDLDILSQSIGIQNLCISYILRNGGGETRLKDFYDLIYGEKERNIKSARRTYNQGKSINLCTGDELN